MLAFTTDSHPDEPGLDTGISHAILRSVATGERPPTFRLHRTSRIVAFGRQDRAVSGYGAAVAAAAGAGYLPIERLAGGRAAVFHEGTLAFSWAMPAPDPRRDIVERFRRASALFATALIGLGIDARVGAVPGEYCPGEYSVNVAGRSKVVGIGQRLVAGAAHVGGVVVVDGGRRIAHVLEPVYRALDLEWDPSTAGDLADHRPTVTFTDVERAIGDVLGVDHDLVATPLDAGLIEHGRRLAPSHLAPSPSIS